jgi:hypothetical protein
MQRRLYLHPFHEESASSFDAQPQQSAVATVFLLLRILLSLQLPQRTVREQLPAQMVHAPTEMQAPEREEGSSELSLAVMARLPLQFL